MRCAIRSVLAILGLASQLAVFGCGAEHPPPAVRSEGLKEALAQVAGAYTWRADLNRYEYSERPRLEEILSARDREETVGLLVECLDDTTPSRSMMNGRPVPLGIVCYEALTQLVYYEPTAPDGDVAAKWPGSISPQASPQELRAAKEAWRRVVHDGLFSFQ